MKREPGETWELGESICDANNNYHMNDNTNKGSFQNKFSVKVGNLAQPAWPPPPSPYVGIPKKEKKNVYFAF